MFCVICLDKCWMPFLKLLFVGCKPSILTNALSDMNIFQKIAILSRAFHDFWALTKRGLKSHRMPLTILLFPKKLIWSMAFVKIEGDEPENWRFSKGIQHFLDIMLRKHCFFKSCFNIPAPPAKAFGSQNGNIPKDIPTFSNTWRFGVLTKIQMSLAILPFEVFRSFNKQKIEKPLVELLF